jgi:outer membrane receptor protein involved in Fe transport
MYRIIVRSILSVLVLFAFAALAMAGETGKIKGKATDKATGEALIGASIVLETTNLGASADVNGEYTVLNVPPGAYSVRATFVGYRTVIQKNVHVTVDLTTEVNFQLESEAVNGPTVEIIAQAPLVNKSATNFVETVSAEKIEELPVRELRDVFALTPGVVHQGDNYYVRGGRLEETAFYVDGVLVNNPMNGQLSLNMISNSLEEVQTQVGGMTAEYGNAMSGIVSASTKTGGPNYNATLEVITDQLGGVDSKNVLGAYSYGQSEYALTIGGPILPADNRFKFFLAGQHVFDRSPATFLDGTGLPISVDSNALQNTEWQIVDRFSANPLSDTPPRAPTGHRTYIANLLNSANYAGGRQQGGVDRNSYALSGNILADLGSMNIKVGGSYDYNTNIGSYGQGLGIINVASGLARPLRTTTGDASMYVKLTHFIDPKTYYTIQGNGFWTWQQIGDNQLFGDIEDYGNPAVVSTLVGPSQNPAPVSLYSFSFAWPGSITSTYTKSLRTNLGGRLDLTHEFGQSWELKVGGELNRYTIRSYTINARDIYLARLQNPGASDWAIYNTAGVSSYGYDIYGNTFSGGSFTDKTGQTVNLDREGPRHPLFLGGYIQNKFEFDDLIINAGLRYDFFDPGAPQYKDPQNIVIDSFDGVPVVADSSYSTTRAKYDQFSPRLGFSFPVADKSVFHASYGKFMQMGRLNDVYTSRMTAAYYFTSVFAYQQPNPNLKPERTTDYEVGFRQQLGEESSFDLSFFYKDTKDLHVIRVVFPYSGTAYYTTVNGDFGTSKGATLTFQMRRTNRVALNANYTLSSSTATGSSSASHFDIAWQDNSYNGQPYFPVIPAATDFDRTHTGNINLDYRFEKDDGPTLFGTKLLERTGLNVLFSFSSGVRYTLSQIDGAFAFSSTNAPAAFENLNASTGPWIYEVDLKLDRSFTIMNNIDFDVYFWVTNLFNRQNVVNGVYSGTGQPDNDGWLSTPNGITWAKNNGPNAVKLYQALENNLAFYGPPRQVRLGLRFGI